MMAKPDSTPAAPASDPFIGKTIGNCEIVEKINEGGTAHIYRGHNVRFGLDRVVKILKPSLTLEEDFFQRFRQEAQLTARLDHPNILRVFDTGEVDGYFYIEMEYIAGKTLREHIQATPRMNEREVLSIALQLARALDYAHKVQIAAPDNELIHGILHRDIKPENIMITPGKVVKLMDFGAAKPLNITSNTMQGMIVGTFHYMSPEQLKGEPLDLRSDFFSLGIVIFEMCTGAKPFAGENLTELIDKITACKYSRLHDLRPSISSMTEELIDRLLSKSPDHRPSDAKEIEENIQVCLQTFSSWSAGRRATVPFSFKRSYPTIALVMSLLALSLSALALWQSGSGVAPDRAASAPAAAGASAQALSGPTLLEKAKDLEGKGLWRDAASIFETVPSIKDGGLANEYLEAQIRLVCISFKDLQQLTKARSVLEKLRLDYSDPAIDAYLGEIYFRQALYTEAKERFDAALASKTASVIPQTPEFRSEVLFFHAQSLDRHYSFVEKNPALLMEAIKAWNYYLEFSSCASAPTENCRFADKRRRELEEIDKKDR